MTRQEFLVALEQELGTLTSQQRQEIISFFQEMLEESGDDGALDHLGSPKEVAAELLEQMSSQDLLTSSPEPAVQTELTYAGLQSLKLDLPSFDVKIRPGQSEEVQISVSDEDRQSLIIEQDQTGLSIKENPAARSAQSLVKKFFNGHFQVFRSGSLTIFLPQSHVLADLDCRLGDGDLDLQGLEIGRIRGHLSNGDAHLQDLTSTDIQISLSNGDWIARNLTAEKIDLDLSNGDASLKSSKIGHCQLDLKNGDVSLLDSQVARLETQLSNGDLTLEGTQVGEETKISLQSGDIELDGASLTNAQIRLSSGDFQSRQTSFAGLTKVKASSGDIACQLLAEQRDKIGIQVRADFGQLSILGQKGDSQTLVYGDLTAPNQLELTTSYGDISVDLG